MESWLRSRPFWHSALFVALAGLLLYCWSLGNGFVTLDDGLLIYANPAVLELTPRSVWHVFTSYDPELYVPLTLLAYQLQHAVFGLQPMWFHVFSLCLHIASAILLIAIGELLTGKRTVGLLTALLFVVHPLNVEAVAWAAAQKDVLSGLFCLATLLCYLQWKECNQPRFRWLCMGTFFLGLLAKVSIITLPIFLVAISWSRRQTLKKSVIELWPLWLLSGLFGVIALYGKSAALQSSGPMVTALLACKSTAFYLLKLAVPTKLSVIYPQVSPVTVFAPDIAVSIAVVTLLVLACVFIARRSRPLSLGLLLFIIALPPNFLNFYKNHALYFGSDRYAYIAGIGIFLFIAMLADTLVPQRNRAGAIGKAVLIVALAAFFGAAVRQTSVWHDSQSLYAQTVKYYPESWVAWNNLGQAYDEQKSSDKALAAFLKAEELAPNSPIVLVNIGNHYRRAGNVDEAIRTYRKAIDNLPATAVRHEEDVVALYFIGEIEEERGNVEQSLQAFRQATELAPELAEPHYNVGVQYQKHGMVAQAEEAFATAVSLRGDLVDARYRLAAVLAERGKLDLALAQLEEIERLSPGYENTREHITNIKGILGR